MIRVAKVEPQQWRNVLALMFGSLPPDQREARIADVLQAERVGELSLDGLLKVEDDASRVVAVGFYTVQGDRTAYLWPPHLCEGPLQQAAGDALLQHISRCIDAAGARMGQCLLEPQDQIQREALSRNGFAHLADLRFLQRPLEKPLPPKPDTRFETVCFDEASNHDRFCRLLEETYVETLDCPRFNDVRSGEDALCSHRTAGNFDPSRWKIYRAEGRDIGVLLLSDHPEQDAWEVVYIGVVPEARGKQFGRSLVLSGLHEARAAGRSSVFLAVDRENTYACRVYTELEFDEVALRAVHVLWPRDGVVV